jgi:hypothetical protein
VPTQSKSGTFVFPVESEAGDAPGDAPGNAPAPGDAPGDVPGGAPGDAPGDAPVADFSAAYLEQRRPNGLIAINQLLPHISQVMGVTAVETNRIFFSAAQT